MPDSRGSKALPRDGRGRISLRSWLFLRIHIGQLNGDAGGVAAWPAETQNRSRSDRIGDTDKDNGDGGGRALSCPDPRVAAGEEHIDLELNELGRHGREVLDLSLGESAFNEEALILHVR